TYDIRDVFGHFAATGTFAAGEPYGSGHINRTFRVKTTGRGARDYILQRVNPNVFRDIPGLMRNIERVTSHMRTKLAAVRGADPDRETLTLIPARDGRPYWRADDDACWRLYLFIARSRSYDIVDSPAMAFEGGRMFGRFQKLVADLPGEPLFETIPDFHNIEMRLGRFRKAVDSDPRRRAGTVRAEIAFVEKRAEEMKIILSLGRAGAIPLRVTHNDTKFNNVLLDENDKGLCVIDLDTVMPGYVHYDVGDSIRTATSTAAEDEADVSKVAMNLALFEGYARGFLSETHAVLTPAEIEHFAFAGRLLTFLIGLRFLTDYLDGDTYFKIAFPDHNIRRARAQFALLKSMEAQADAMRRLVDNILM
ncbi:MAG: phosphotransferase enzyme family protein, partial [Kiritimatiellia bacterium]